MREMPRKVIFYVKAASGEKKTTNCQINSKEAQLGKNGMKDMKNTTQTMEYRPFAEEALWIGHRQSKQNVLRVVRHFQCARQGEGQLLICGLGFFSVKLNGKPLDDWYYKPLVTDYGLRDVSKNPALLLGTSHRVCVYRYDVSDLLVPGENTLEILLGNGYFQNDDRPEEPFVSYGDKRVIFQLTGAAQVYSDSRCQVSYLPVISGLYEGDQVDFSAMPEEPEPAVPASAPEGAWCEPEMPADRIRQRLQPVKVWQQDGTVYDFGINHSGGVRFSIRGRKGQTIRLYFAEVLNEDNTLNMHTSRWEERGADGRLLHRIDQTGTYILSGGEDTVEPLFSWHCYRYVRIEGAEGTQISQMESLYIHTDLKATGDFCCSEPLFGEIHEKVRRTVYNNLHAGLLTDCPHREKRSYTGDGHIIAEAMLYDLDSVPFFAKWLEDLIGAQTENGFIPYTVPYMSGGGGYGWSSAIVVIPYLLYRFTGNISYVQKAYPAVVRWVNYCENHAVDHIIRSGEQEWLLGDWLAPDITGFSVPLINTLWYYRSVETAAEFAALLEKNREALHYREQKQQISDAINSTFFDQEVCCYGRGIQGENVLPLAWGVAPPEYRAALKQKVRRHYEATDYRIDTGIIATPVVLEYLTANGMEDIAYKMMTRSGYPSYRYMLDGETTVPEHWSKMWPDYFINDTKYVKGGGDVSHCHPMFGSVVAWMYKFVAGLDLTALPDKTIYFAPRLTQYIASAGGKTKTPYGEAAIRWQRNGREFRAEVEIPEGMEGVFQCPEGMTLQKPCKSNDPLRLTAGKWIIEAKI